MVITQEPFGWDVDMATLCGDLHTDKTATGEPLETCSCIFRSFGGDVHVCLYAGRAVEAYSNVCLCFCVHRREIKRSFFYEKMHVHISMTMLCRVKSTLE